MASAAGSTPDRDPIAVAAPEMAPRRTARGQRPRSDPAVNGRARRAWRDRMVIAGFLLPALLVYAVFVLWPILNSFYFSTLDWNGVGQPVQVGLGNFRELVSDRAAWEALWHNIVLIAVSLAVQLPVGLALALLLLAPIRGTKVLRTIYFLPLLMSTVAIGILWSFIYNPTFGLVNRVLEMLGLEALRQGWLGQPSTALASVIVVICWQFIPFYMILYRAGLTSIPNEVNEAAVVDGAASWPRFRLITLPLLRSTTRTAVVLSVIGSLRYFDLIWVMTRGGNSTEVLATYMYSQAFSSSRLGYGSAVAVALFVVAMVVTVLVLSRLRGAQEY
jgi:raffinose/stachyose/melibiose transport system permease protein